MDSPIFRNYPWYEQSDPVRRPSFREVPVYHVSPAREAFRTVHRSPVKSAGPRVVKIPVHFVGTEQVDRSVSAVNIQKVFRGFLVRKFLKKIKDIKFQVDSIEEKLSRREVVDMVRKDEKERLRMNESLMSLLFKLDSISGLDIGVRACRKAVIRKAIALQERIDAIVGVDSEGNDRNVNQEIGIGVSDSSNQTVDPVKPESSSSLEHEETLEDSRDSLKVEENDDEEDDIIDIGVDREVKVSMVEENSIEGYEKEKSGDVIKEENGKLDDNKRNAELMERMMEENGKMMNMMTQLFERYETQMRTLNSLASRVELLEKAILYDRLMRKKKKTNNACRDRDRDRDRDTC